MNLYNNQTNFKNNRQGKRSRSDYVLSTVLILIRRIVVNKYTFVTISLILGYILYSPTVTRFSLLPSKKVLAQTQSHSDAPLKEKTIMKKRISSEDKIKLDKITIINQN